MLRWIFIVLVIALSLHNHSGLQLSAEMQSWCGCISHHEAQQLLSFQRACEQSTEAVSIQSSIDLSRSTTSLLGTVTGIANSNNDILATWNELQSIAKKQKGCYALYDDGSKPWRVSTISKTTDIPASLCPPLESGGAPTIVLGGFTMHRIVGEKMNPMVDTANKLSCVPIRAGMKVLDTCMGLGYTAMEAAQLMHRKSITGTNNAYQSRSVAEGVVTTIEYDDATVEMAAHNPWSQALFDGSLPIEVLQVLL